MALTGILLLLTSSALLAGCYIVIVFPMDAELSSNESAVISMVEWLTMLASDWSLNLGCQGMCAGVPAELLNFTILVGSVA